MQKITKYLCGIVQQAAKITNQPFNIYNKDDFGDIVTDIDKEVETFLIEKLNHKYPEFDIVSEEFNPDRDLTSHCFVIDPIDGTKNFAAGIPLWGLQIAAIENGEVVASVIYLPKLNELYYADCDGAFLNGTRLEISNPEKQNRKTIFSIVGNDLPGLLQKGDNVNHRNFRHVAASSVAYAWVAAGRLDGYCLCFDKKWDYVPGMYLVQMAGGLTIDKMGMHVAATKQDMLEFFNQIFSPAVKSIKEETATATKPKTNTKTKSASKTVKSTTKKSK